MRNIFIYTFLTLLILLSFIYVFIYVNYIQIEKQNKLKLGLNRNFKIFCIVFTKEENLFTKARVNYDTWAKKCDNVRFISTLPADLVTGFNTNNQSVEFIIDNSYTVLNPFGFTSGNDFRLTSDKLLLAFKDIYSKFKEYDWYLKADDDTFIFVDNLRKFLKDKDPDMPVTYGYDLKMFVKKGYHSSNGGYVLSKEAFYRLGKMLNVDKKYCKLTGIEDIDLHTCLRRLYVYPSLSIDQFARERFHCLSLIHFYKGLFPADLVKQFAANPPTKGLNCCSDTTVSFYQMQPNDQIKLDRILKLQAESYDKTFKFIIKNYFNLNDSEIHKK